jgi:hypothetical protein
MIQRWKQGLDKRKGVCQVVYIFGSTQYLFAREKEVQLNRSIEKDLFAWKTLSIYGIGNIKIIFFVVITTPSNILISNSIQDFRNRGIKDQRINKGMASHALNQILGIKNL